MQESLSDEGIATRTPETPTRLTTSETGIILTPHSTKKRKDKKKRQPKSLITQEKSDEALDQSFSFSRAQSNPAEEGEQLEVASLPLTQSRKNLRTSTRAPLKRTASFENFAKQHVEFFEIAERLVSPSVILCGLAADGNLEKLKDILENTSVDVNAGDYDGRTALHLAAEEGHAPCVEYLLSKGANVNVVDRWDATPLRGALQFGHKDIAKLLQLSGARVSLDTSVEASKRGKDAIEKEELLEHIKGIFNNIHSVELNRKTNKKLRSDEVPLTNEESAWNAERDLDTITRRALIRWLEAVYGIEIKHHTALQVLINHIEDQGIITWDKFKVVFEGDPTLPEEAESAVTLFLKILHGTLAIPQWSNFIESVLRIAMDVMADCKGKGKNACNIHELANVDRNKFGLSIFTVDGQRLNFGDYDTDFPIYSCGLPLLYSFVADEIGLKNVHRFVGREPSGASISSFELNEDKRPHNPLTSAGGLLISSLYKPGTDISTRFCSLLEKTRELAGGAKVGFSQTVYLSEKDDSYLNYGLANFMKAENAFPEKSNINSAVDFYLQLCSLEMTAEKLATVAATYANNGKFPMTSRSVIKPTVVHSTLQVMYSCGMYDYSGEWACTIGLPAKSGTSGCIYVVIPGKLGMCVWSPPLDKNGNSYAGVEFYKRFVDRFKWSIFDVLFAHNE